MIMPCPKNKKKLTQKIVHEFRVYFIYTAFLLLLFTAFTSYERVLLDELNIENLPYGYCLVKALIMAKVIMLGEAMNLGQKYAGKALIIPVLYKTIIFCIFLLILLTIEQLIRGVLAGHSVKNVYEIFIAQRFDISIAKVMIMFFIFIFFFSVMETARALGHNKLYDMFFKGSSH